MSEKEFIARSYLLYSKKLIVEGDEAVQKLIFLNRRAKSKLAAGLVASGPAGKGSQSRTLF